MISSSDEIGEIAGSINQLLDYIRTVINNIAHNTQNLKNYVQLSSESAEVSSGKISTIARHIQQMNQAMQETTENVQEVSNMVISTVNVLTEEAEGMLLFMKEQTVVGCNELVKVGNQYSEDTKNFYEMMESNWKKAKRLAEGLEVIKKSTVDILYKVEDSAKHIENINENVTELTSDLHQSKEQSEDNLRVTNNLEVEVEKFII